MWAFLAALAGILAQRVAAGSAEHMAEFKANIQHKRDVHMQLAQMLDPSTPTFGYDNRKFQDAQSARHAAFEQQAGQQVASLLPSAVGAISTWADPNLTGDNFQAGNEQALQHLTDQEAAWRPPGFGGGR